MAFLRAALGPRLAVLAGVALIGFCCPGAVSGRRPDSLPRCAFGRLPAELRVAVPNAAASEQHGFDATLSGLSAAERRRADTAFAAGVAAYMYGMPTVLLRATIRSYPPNLLIGLGGLATSRSNSVVAPNHDTLYSVARLDLSGEPVVIETPPTRGRYAVLQLIDANTDVISYIGSGQDRTRATHTLIGGPGWHGAPPGGVRVVRSPTRTVWVIGRTLVDGPSDTAAATALMAQNSATVLSAWSAGERRAELVLHGPPPHRTTVLPAGAAFYDALGVAMSSDPPPSADRCAVASFASAGIGSGQKPSSSGDPVLVRALTAARTAGARLVDTAVRLTRRESRRHHNEWTLLTGDVGRFGTDYASRAVIARVALASNVPREALYPTTDVDSRGRPLRGTHRYTVTFRAGALPPVRAFWSLTLYNGSLQFYANREQRYAIGDRTAGLHYNRDRSLTVYVQHDRPPGAKAANWLPAPTGPFELYLRLYEPRPSAATGDWQPPAVLRKRSEHAQAR